MDLAHMTFSYEINYFSHELDVSLLLRRLKVLGKILSRVSVDINTSPTEWEYNDLAMHLASSDLLSHSNDGVKNLTAYSLAQVLRIRQFNHPYNDDQLHHIWVSLITLTERLADESNPLSKYQEKVLDLLLIDDVNKVFKHLDSLQKLTTHLFSTIIGTVNAAMSLIIKDKLIKLLGTLISYLPKVPQQLIRMIFESCKYRNKVANKPAYDMTVRFIHKCKDILGPAIGEVMVKNLFESMQMNQSEEREMNPSLYKHWMTRLWKLHSVCSDITIPIMMCLETALLTTNDRCRYLLIIFLGRLFGTPSHVPLHKDCSALWRAFLGRFQDRHLEVRLLCLEQVPDLFKLDDLKEDLVLTLRKRTMDPTPRVRTNVASLVFSLTKDYAHVPHKAISGLFLILEEMRMDLEVKVRFPVLHHMAELYDIFCENQYDDNLPNVLKVLEKYPTYILDHYWIYEHQFIKERLTVIQLLNKYLVPHTMPPKQRMKRLMKVLATLDSRACTALMEIKYQQHIACGYLQHVIKFVEEERNKGSTEESVAMLNAMAVCNYLPLHFKLALEVVMSFTWRVSEGDQHAKSIKDLLLHKSLEELPQILEFLKESKKYSEEYCWLLQLSSDMSFDKKSVKIFVSFLNDFLQGRRHLLQELKINGCNTIIENGLCLLKALGTSNLSFFCDHELISTFIGWLQISETESPSLKLHVLRILTALQTEDDGLMLKYPGIMNELLLVCQDSCSEFDIKTAKWAIRCLMITESRREELAGNLHSLVQTLVKGLSSTDLTRVYNCIYCLGYISFYMGSYFTDVIPDMVSEEVMNGIMLIKGDKNKRHSSWLSFEELPIDAKIKVKYLKFLSQWADGERKILLERVTKLLFDVIGYGGAYPRSASISKSEKAWMRLAAGVAVLRLLRRGKMSMLTAAQFYLLSDLMMDAVPGVREQFSKKLRIGLRCEYPKMSMPVELLSLFVLSQFEDSDIEDGEPCAMVTNLSHLFSIKLNFIKWFNETGVCTENFHTENQILVYGLLALSHSGKFTRSSDMKQLMQVKKQLKAFLNLLFTNNEADLGFYQKQVKMVKMHKLKGENEDSNKRLWTLCDISLFLIKKKYRHIPKKIHKPNLPMEFFEAKPIKNQTNYLTKKTIMSLSLLWDQDTSEESEEEGVNEPEVSGNQLGETAEIDSIVVMVGEGEVTIEDEEWNSDDSMSLQSIEEHTHAEVHPGPSTTSRKRKISEV